MTNETNRSINISDLSETRNKILDKINSNKGVTLATRDMTLEDEDDEETDADRKAQAEDILARFRKPVETTPEN
jgi:hypothetical protein